MQVFIAFVFSLLIVQAPHAWSADPPIQPIRIGLSGPFSGGSSPMGESMRNGIRLAAMELNEMGGLLGRPIELIERDDQANPERGRAIARELTQEAKVAATVGVVNTGVGLASIDFYQQARVPLLVAVSTGSALTKKFAPPNASENYIFRLALRTDIETEFLLADVVKRKLHKLAILADSTPYGDAGLNDLLAAMERRGLKPVAVERYQIGDQSMQAQLERARAAGAQAVITYGIGPELAAIARDRSRMGWQVPLFGSWTLSMQNFVELAGKSGSGALMPQTFIQEGGGIRRNTFLVGYKDTFHAPRIPSPMSAAQGYDAMYLLAAAIRQAGSTEGSKLKEALESLKKTVYGVVTHYDKPFSRQDHDAITLNMLAMGVVRNGRVVYAYAEDEGRSLLARKKSLQ